MPTMADYAAASARLLYERLVPRNPDLTAQVVADLGLVNDTAQVLVFFGGATRLAVWTIPNAIELGHTVVVTRLDARHDATLAVIAPLYQSPWGGTWGTTTGTWGADNGSTWGVGPPGAYDGP